MKKYEYKAIKKENKELVNTITICGKVYRGTLNEYTYDFNNANVEDAIAAFLQDEKERFLGKTHKENVNGIIQEIPYTEENFGPNGLVEKEVRKEAIDYFKKNTVMGFEEMLNNYGKEGWEFVSWENNVVILKRKLD